MRVLIPQQDESRVMKQFNLYSHAVLGPRAVKRGFSWPAFFFTGIWALVCKLWARGAIMFTVLFLTYCTSMVSVGEFAEEEVETGSPEVAALALLALLWPVTALVVGVVAGVRGNHWRDQQARQQGFVYVTTVPAQSAEAALTQLSHPTQSMTKEGAA